MNLSEYQKFTASVAIYPKTDRRQTKEYLILGLLGELGEVLDKRKKAIRDNVDNTEAILDELGDVLWYTSELANFYEINLDSLHWSDGVKTIGEEDINQHLIDTLSRTAESLSILNLDSFNCIIERVLGRVFADVSTVSLAIRREDFYYDDIIERNVAKLTARKAKGTLSGSGDNR